MEIISDLIESRRTVSLILSNNEKIIGMIIIALIVLLIVLGIIYLFKKIWE